MLKLKILISIYLCFSILISCPAQTNQLPKPSGNYLTGVDYLSFTDTSRMELFDNSNASFRKIAAKVWYPSDTQGIYAPYIENADYAVDNLNFPEAFRNLLTNSFKDVPISNAEKAYPVLIFSHGWGEHFSQNTVLMEELASHGYVVFSLSHDFESKFSYYPDGNIVSLNPNSERFIQIMNEQQNPQSMELYNEMFDADSDNKRMKIFIETSKLMPTLLKESPKYWAEDMEFFIERLTDINDNNFRFKSKLDLEKIGVFGMSMGGIATNELCIKNEKVKAGVNIDGGLYGSLIDTVLNTPFMFINSQRYMGYGNLFTNKSDTDCYSVTLRNSDHYNFTDYALFPSETDLMIGTIDTSIPIELMNSIILAFFDQYLLGKTNYNLQKISLKYETEYVFNKN